MTLLFLLIFYYKFYLSFFINLHNRLYHERIINSVYFCLLISFLIIILINSNTVSNSVKISLALWKDNLLTTLFPFMIICNIIINLNFIEYTNIIIGKLYSKIFKLPGTSSFIFIISLIAGFPSGAKYINYLLNKKEINIKQAEHLLTFTHYPSPMFVFGFIGSTTILDKRKLLLFYLSIILGGIITGIIFKDKSNEIKEKTNYKKEKTSINLSNILKDSIIDSLNTMFLLFGIITIISIFTSIVTNYLYINTNITPIIKGLFEITQGINSLNYTSYQLLEKIIIITFLLSFGGLSIHMQVLGILSEHKIKYKYYLLSRIIHSLISIMLVLTFNKLF